MMTRTDGHPGAGVGNADGSSAGDADGAGAGAGDPLQQPIMNIPVAVQCPVSPPAQPSPAQPSTAHSNLLVSVFASPTH